MTHKIYKLKIIYGAKIFHLKWNLSNNILINSNKKYRVMIINSFVKNLHK